MMRTHYGAKKDANHAEIIGVFRQLGATVLDLSTIGCGVPDLLVGCGFEWHLVDVKNPKTSYGRRGLNPLQTEWAKAWRGGPIYLISSVDEAIAFVKGERKSIKHIGGYLA